MFGFGQADDIVPDVDFPPCIQIKADLYHQDCDTNSIIDQKFTFNRRNDKPHIPRYKSSDGTYMFKYNDEFDTNFQWFLVGKGALLETSYLKTPAPYVGAVLSKNPLIIADETWEIYTNAKWQSVTNPIKVKICEESKPQVQPTNAPDGSIELNQGPESTQSNHAQVSKSTVAPSTILQPGDTN